MKVQARGNRLLFLGGVVHVGQATLAAVLPIKVGSHEDAGTTLFTGAFATQAVDLAVVVHPVVLEHGELDLAVLVFLLLGCGVILLLSFLGTPSEPQNQVKGRLFLNVIIGQSTSIFKLLSGKNQSLLIWGNSLLILDLGLHILNGVGGLHLERDGLAREGLNKNLHS